MNRNQDQWNRLVSEGLRYGGDSNASLPFAGMSRKYGKAWVEYLKAAWSAKDGLTEEEFAELNGGVPTTFIERNLRPCQSIESVPTSTAPSTRR